MHLLRSKTGSVFDEHKENYVQTLSYRAQCEEEKTAKKYYRESTTNINDLPDVNLVQIFEKFPWEERLKLEQVCKKWQYVGKNLSWSNERIFDNTPYKNWPESKFMQIEAFFDRCGHHLRHLVFHSWSPVIILSLLGMAPNVQHLKFWNMTDYGLAECFKVMTSLEYLRISDRGHLLNQHSFVQFPPNLKFISLHRIKNINQILEWIAIGCKDLKALSVSPDYINENGLKAISRMKRLTYLEMNGYASQDASEDIFEALTELRALEIETVNGKLIAAIAQHCNNLEHLQIEVFEAKHANISCFATLPNLCSLEILGECCLEQTIKLINRLIANDKLQYITSNITVPLEILFEMLRRCKVQSFQRALKRFSSLGRGKDALQRALEKKKGKPTRVATSIFCAVMNGIRHQVPEVRLGGNNYKNYSFECVYCDPVLEMYSTTTREAMINHCRITHDVEEQIARRHYFKSRAHINDLADVNLILHQKICLMSSQKKETVLCEKHPNEENEPIAEVGSSKTLLFEKFDMRKPSHDFIDKNLILNQELPCYEQCKSVNIGSKPPTFTGKPEFYKTRQNFNCLFFRITGWKNCQRTQIWQ
ncbi:hypothetical protein Ddc_13848 [Ditylenchus destructor]|nr:hypothetical protein Ddc_13848 [Ditylenchus destructor]